MGEVGIRGEEVTFPGQAGGGGDMKGAKAWAGSSYRGMYLASKIEGDPGKRPHNGIWACMSAVLCVEWCVRCRL